MNARLCCLDHHGYDTPALPGIDLCAGHREDLQQDLNDTDLLIHLIWEMTLPTRSPDNARGRHVDPAAPGNLAAIAATDWRTRPDNCTPKRPQGDHLVSVVGVIGKWGTRIWWDIIDKERVWVQPTNLTIGWALERITEHVTWLCCHPRVITFAQDIHDTAHMLRDIAGEIRPPIGRHLAPHPRHPEADCGGRLYPLSDTTFGVQCIDCGERIAGTRELRRLGLVLSNA